MRKLLCRWFGRHLYQGGLKSQLVETKITKTEFYIFQDRCIVCGESTRWWNTPRELGDIP